jgi:hypothetical protein
LGSGRPLVHEPLGGEVLGVIEFFSREMRPPGPDLFNMMSAIDSQVGQFIERKDAKRRGS